MGQLSYIICCNISFMIPSFLLHLAFLITSEYVQTHEILSVPFIYLKTFLLDFCLLPLDLFSRLAAQLSRIPFHSYPGENFVFLVFLQ